MTDILWLVAVLGGPVLLGLVFWYAIRRNRKVTPQEHLASERGVRRAYGHDASETKSP